MSTGSSADPQDDWTGTAVRAELERLGFHPSRKLGQNFLCDPNLARAIVRDADVGAGDWVLEVGPGPGILTHVLVGLGVRVLAVELDSRLAAFARQRIGPVPGFELIEGDVLAGKHALAPEVQAALPAQGDYHVVSNLPYAIASPLLVLLAALEHPPTSMTVLLQREHAQRIASAPGSKRWGGLAVQLQASYTVAVVRSVDARLFWPRPKVESELLRLELRNERPGAELRARLARLCARLFQRRRQALGRHFAELAGERAEGLAALGRHGVDPRARPEALGLEQFAGLAGDPEVGRWLASQPGPEATGG